mmetsp:Transcript_89438/g.277941  ORF Transcript_89438/g.277941 Transcript_89438/m.277941 type:complete len:90 (+) Transcript_89438:249-518(+)
MAAVEVDLPLNERLQTRQPCCKPAWMSSSCEASRAAASCPVRCFLFAGRLPTFACLRAKALEADFGVDVPAFGGRSSQTAASGFHSGQM